MQSRIQNVSKESGVTLVEVMIAMLLGLFLVGGITQIFASSRHTYRMHEATSRMQETGRMALEMLSRDIRMADFWGCASDIADVVNHLDADGAGYIDFGSGGVFGIEGGAGVPDSLTLRGGVDSGLGVQPPFGPSPSANIKVAADNGLDFEDVVFIADCATADIFQITNADPNGTGDLVHNTGAGSPGNLNASNPLCPGANAHCLSKVYGADSSVFTVSEITYTVGMGSEDQPALFRNGLEFLDGVEDLQILYGEDLDAPGTPGAGVANYYVPADQVADMNNVISIRVAVVARSYDDNLTSGIAQNYAVFGTNRVAPDTRLRQVYTSTINVRNRL